MLPSFKNDKWWNRLPMYANYVHLGNPFSIAVNCLKIDDSSSQNNHLGTKSQTHCEARLVYIPYVKFVDIVYSNDVVVVRKEPLNTARVVVSKSSFLIN